MIYRDDIQKVYDLLAAPERWTQGTNARDAAGQATDPRDEFAVSWCLMGAKIRAQGWGSECGFTVADMVEPVGVCDVTKFNDAPGRTHAEVLALLRSAMERAPVRPDGGVGT